MRAMDRLTAVAVRNMKWSGKPAGDKHTDGAGLYLLVNASGKYWNMDYHLAGKRNTHRIGVYPAKSLTQARKDRDKARELVKQGIDPNKRRQTDKLKNIVAHENSFQAVAAQWFDIWKIGKAEKTIEVKWKRLANDVFPSIGNLPITEITPSMLIAIVKAVNARGARDVAERVLYACNQVFRYAVTHQIADRNPVPDIVVSEILPEHAVANRARVSQEQLPQLLKDIYAYKGRGEWMTSYGLQLLCLTFVRTSELITTPWSEIDFDNARWVIPKERMKKIKSVKTGIGTTPHIVPLSRQALAIFEKLREMNGHREFVFYSTRSKSRHMSNGTMLQALYRMGYKGIMTGHGFRGVAATIIKGKGKFQEKHVKLQLAHMPRNKVDSAYDWALHEPERASIMQWWGDYVENCTADNILTLPRRSA